MPRLQETQLHCLADRRYYEAPARLRDEATRYPLDRAEPPDGWVRAGAGLWTSLIPAGVVPPEQGWKIHVSTVPAGAGRTLEITARLCREHRVPFKFLRSEQALRLMSDKHMKRSGSGKFLTLYPPDEPSFLRLAEALAVALKGRPGPYILSDLRIGSAPVFVRYGAFRALWCRDEHGATVPALRHPDGRLVPDTRDVVFRLPAWVKVPAELRPHLAARAAARDDGFPYTVERALQFSNAGGIYLARHRETGRRVVLREARPHSGLDRAGDDAVTRLHREHRALTRLAGLDCVPAVHGVRRVWEHHFLVEEYIEGTTLLEELVTRYAMVHGDRSPAELAAYGAWVAGVTERLRRALDAIHARGLRFGDLHPSNVMVRPDGSLVLVDFEYATDLDDPATPLAGAPGMQAPAGTPGAAADRYALRALWLHLLIPLTEMAHHDRDKARTLERWARARFGLGPDAGPPRPALPGPGSTDEGGTGEATVARLFGGPVPDWAGLRRGLLAGIRAGATPERTDRLFPGDPAGFGSGGVCAAHGAAGVLHALRRTGAEVAPEWVEWLSGAALRRDPARPGGLYDGLPGAALVLDALGRRATARELLDRALAAPPAPSADLLTGRAGTALAALRLATSASSASTTSPSVSATAAAGGAAARPGATRPDPALLEYALRTARELDALVRGDRPAGLTAPASAGLLRGLSGVALLHLELLAHTGESWLLDAAGAALRRDAAHCAPGPGGTVQVRDGRRHLLYLDQGSGGFALVAREYLAHRPDAELAGLLPGVRRGCGLEFVREPGLVTGRAGLLAAAHALDAPDAGAPQAGAPRPDVLASARNLAWHLVADGDRLLVPGAGLLRFSADLATGAAGVLLSLHTLAAAPGAYGPGELLRLLTLG
ncbi:class III lanthionine synthetase LanKC [Streptomyces sp. LP05-1]|uniref:non-specific serine/threonine protein kinase n=1 Tax=Streptomyces pyxinae TaxID=2970734 RepID=A0ABT2CH41_9ACTN|nr:class III lanthionine synthetase LanKC [Streptomyces sp. LP05-1]MCS0636708.1 class III lanthionine synthetase LanKC [Streptomyces sp. LP05-1]